jgi:hypothetical protein
MLPFFPDPYPDELLYSVFSRYHLWSGNMNYKETQNDLFGNHSAKPIFDLPSRIDALVKQLPIGANYSSEGFIYNNTLYPYYAVFLPPERADQVLAEMKGDHGGSIHMRIGIMAGGICSISGLRYCPTCLKDDYETYGEVYWHRTHQAPGVFVCPKHSLYLISKCLECGENLSNSHIQEYKALDIHCSQGHDLRTTSINYPTDELNHLKLSLLLLAKDIDYILKNNLKFSNLNRLRETYISLLQRMQLASVSGSVYLRELVEQFSLKLTPELLSCVESKLDLYDDHSWLATALRKPRKVIHPIRHLLIIQFLSGSVESFIPNLNFEYKPFGNGPWPCLNPVAYHFKKDVVSDLKITRCTDTSLPVGTFKCKCGFIYSRRGPDQVKEDRYRVGRIKSFGSVWEKRLQKLATGGQLGLRGMAREMQADPGTVKKYIEKLDLRAEYLNVAKKTSIIESSIPNNNDMPQTQMQILEIRRHTMLTVINEADMLSRTQIRNRIPGIFIWLYRHDREWLNSILPPPVNRRVSQNSRVDWEKRDQFLCQKVKEAATKLLLTDEKPVRITLSKVGRSIKELAVLEKHLDRLPRTKAMLETVVESVDDFEIRRIKWIIRELNNQGHGVVEWKVIRYAGLSPNISETVKQALRFEIELFNT